LYQEIGVKILIQNHTAMKKKKNIILVVILFLPFINVLASNNLLKIKKPDKSFVISSKSRNVKMAKGQTYKIKMKLRKKRYYFISVDAKKKLGDVQFKIIDTQNNNEIIYDNSANEFKKEIILKNQKDRNVIIEIRTMPCCYENELAQKANVKLLFANKRLNKNEDFNINNRYNIYAIN